MGEDTHMYLIMVLVALSQVCDDIIMIAITTADGTKISQGYPLNRLFCWSYHSKLGTQAVIHLHFH